jgi:hypothetical protein
MLWSWAGGMRRRAGHPRAMKYGAYPLHTDKNFFYKYTQVPA